MPFSEDRGEFGERTQTEEECNLQTRAFPDPAIKADLPAWIGHPVFCKEAERDQRKRDYRKTQVNVAQMKEDWTGLP